MRFSRLKITEGDLIIVTHSNAMAYSEATAFVSYLQEWLQQRQLHNVRVIRNHVSNNDRGFDVAVLSSIDLFESEILNKS